MGFRLDTDAWQREYDEARNLALEVLQTIQERNTDNASGGPEASRKTATARRKIGTLGTMVERLLKWLDSSEAASLQHPCITGGAVTPAGCRDNLLAGARQGGVQGPGAASSAQGSKETEATAELDSRGLLQLQQQTMVQQDEVLGQMEKTVRNTKHIALAIGEEVDLQTRLLDELDEETDVTQSRLKAATVKAGHTPPPPLATITELQGSGTAAVVFSRWHAACRRATHKQGMQVCLSQEASATLLDLPDSILNLIVLELDYQACGTLSQTSGRLRGVVLEVLAQRGPEVTAATSQVVSDGLRLMFAGGSSLAGLKALVPPLFPASPRAPSGMVIGVILVMSYKPCKPMQACADQTCFRVPPSFVSPSLPSLMG
ncbi:hypothetical protein QJQ45_028629 [Haematococcus lacustris]|nr:hypothetical protein QJQ45_028629 [Haematococcus lacustris]